MEKINNNYILKQPTFTFKKAKIALKFSIFLMLLLCWSLCFLCCCNTTTKDQYISLNPLVKCDNPSLNYVYNKTDINNNLAKQKEQIIKSANELISNDKLNEALNLLKNSIFCNEKQIVELLNIIETKQKQSSFKEYNGGVSVLMFEPIISFPEVLKNNSNLSSSIDENHITINEFEKILLSLYERNYVLINPASINQKLYLPSGKQPIVLALKTAFYSAKNGNVSKLILDDHNTLTTYTPKRSINDRLHHSNDFITLLNTFVDEHPTFSINGAKGLICIDGSNGILGYKTQKTNANSKFQVKKCMEVAGYLKENGWKFASLGYKYGVSESSVNFASGLSHWKEIVEPIVGETNIYCSCFDSILDDYKSSLLSSYEYYNFINIGQIKSDFAINSHLICGKTLRQNSAELNTFFDCEKVYDHINRLTTFCSI